MSKDLVAKLSSIKQAHEKAVTAKATAEGRMQQLQATLKKEFGVSTIKAAEALLTKMENTLKQKRADLEDKINRIQEEFQWD